MERNTEAEAWKIYLVKEKKLPELFTDVQKLVSEKGISHDDAFFLKAPDSRKFEKKIRSRIEAITRTLKKAAAEVVETIQKDDLAPVEPEDFLPGTYKQTKPRTIDDVEEVFGAKTLPPVKKPSKLEDIANADGPTKSLPPAQEAESQDEDESQEGESFGLEVEDDSAIPVVESEDVRKAGAKRPGVSKKLVGAGFDKFEIQEKLSEGGMGYVFTAMDRDLERLVVIKVGKKKDPDAQARFQKEKEVHSQIENKNVAPIYEGGYTTREVVVPSKKAGEDSIRIPAGVPFLVMRLLHGRTLSKLLTQVDKGKAELDLYQRLRLFKDICYGVKALHDKGVIHRDLKPDNIWVDERSEPQIIDLGLAKKIKEIETDDVTKKIRISQDADMKKTIEGAIAGTVLYMSPEQADGKISELDERSDIYALGAIFYEMLSLDTMIDPSGNIMNVLNRVSTQEIPVPKRYRHNSSTEKALPADVRAIFEKMTDRNKATRYRKLDQVIQDLDNFFEGKQVSARTYHTHEKIGKWYLRNKIFTVPTTIALMLVLAGGTVAGMLSAKASRAEAQTAVAEKEKAQADAEVIKKEKEKVIVAIQVKEETDIKRNKANKKIDCGAVYYKNKDYDRAIDEYTVAINVYPESAGAHYSRAFALRNKAEAQLNRTYINETEKQAKEKEAKGILKQSLEDMIRAVELDSENTMYLMELAQAQELVGKNDEAEKQFDAAIKKAEQNKEKPHPYVLLNFGAFYSRTNRPVQAIEKYKEYLQDMPEDDGLAYADIANEYITLKQYDEAKRYAQIALDKRWYGVYYELGAIAAAKADFTEAERLLLLAKEHRTDRNEAIDYLLREIAKKKRK